MNFKEHFYFFFFSWMIVGLWAVFNGQIPLRVFFGVYTLPFLNPDIDQAINPESHRWFLTHSVIPSLAYWYCFLPLGEEYSMFIFLIGGFYPYVHIICDLTGVQGYGCITLFPYPKKWNDLKWVRLSVRNSYIWFAINSWAFPIILGVLAWNAL